MGAKQTIQKILFVLMWFSIGAGMTVLLLAAIGKKNRDICRDYHITINQGRSGFFFDEKDVLDIITEIYPQGLKGCTVSSIDLRSIETALEKNSCIRDAQLYFNNQDVLHIMIQEREPVARIFTEEGNSFYIDRDASIMPLSEKHHARVPVFTGFPEYKKPDEERQQLLNQVKQTALFIQNDSFWMAQVAQIDINSKKEFDMIPAVGNHIVKLGNAVHLEAKFNRLFVFYRDVLSKTGFEKYPVIDVRYDRQVVAVRDGKVKPRVDTVQLKSNVQKLLQQAQQKRKEVPEELPENTNRQEVLPVAIPPDEFPQPDTDKSLQPGKTNGNPKAEEKKIPKAVMPKRDSIQND
jgi:cell division protein FtsQ